MVYRTNSPLWQVMFIQNYIKSRQSSQWTLSQPVEASMMHLLRLMMQVLSESDLYQGGPLAILGWCRDTTRISPRQVHHNILFIGGLSLMLLTYISRNQIPYQLNHLKHLQPDRRQSRWSYQWPLAILQTWKKCAHLQKKCLWTVVW